MLTKTEESDFTLKREQAQRMSFAKIQELLQRNVNKTTSQTFMQYTKELLKTYAANPASNIITLRQISRFIERNSMLYKKLIMYYAAMPLFYYNVVDESDDISEETYSKVLRRMSKFDQIKIGYNAIYSAVRDGMYVGYMYDSADSGLFMMPLDVDYIRIYGKTTEGQWIAYMDATYFDKGNNKDYVTSEVGTWDECFVLGYQAYKENGNDYKWFRLPPEKTFVMLAVDDSQFEIPIPFWLPLFKSLLDLLDLEDLVQDKNELENYKLIINKIPLISGSNDVDDYAISLEMAQAFEKALEEVVPELVGCALLPGLETETISFENSNSTKDTDTLNNSIENLFANAGASRLVIASGSSTNATALKYSLLNDVSNVWFFVNQYEGWLNYFIQKNINKNFELYFHRVTWYTHDEYVNQRKELTTLGLETPMGVLSALYKNPFLAYKKVKFEKKLGLYNELVPLQSSYNSSTNGTVGRPQSDETELSPEGEATRSSDKNVGTKIAKDAG